MRKKLLHLNFCTRKIVYLFFTGETIQRVVSNHAIEVSPAGSIDVVRYLVV